MFGTLNAWIRRASFPGPMPGLKEITALLERRFSVLDVENLRLHYAQTRHWLARFDAVEQQLLRCSIPRSCACGGFTYRLHRRVPDRRTATIQVVFARPQLNTTPWTRAMLYQLSPAPA